MQLLKNFKTLRNRANNGQDPQGKVLASKWSDITAIKGHLLVKKIDNTNALWLDIAKKAGIILPETAYFKSPGKQINNTQLC